ncbi:MAG TPA: hypothetical protein VJ752_07340 [Burkholderiaceae bacterium]|nr:hypothetical protein [Burkholderiaceae bacterium]
MLSEFIGEHRDWLLERARTLRAGRSQLTDNDKMEQGFRLFLDQLIESLQIEQASGAYTSGDVSGPPSGIPSHSKIGIGALAQGSAMFKLGISIDDLVHSYGDLCHAIVDLVQQESLQLEVYEYRMLNHCLDNAIATAVTEFSFQHDEAIARDSLQSHHARLSALGADLRKQLGIATTAIAALKARELTLGGVTGSILERSMLSLTKLLDELPLKLEDAEGDPGMLDLFSLALFVEQIKRMLEPCAEALSRRLSVDSVDAGLALQGRRDTLLAAVIGLLQITLGHTAAGDTISINAFGRGKRILIDIASPHHPGLANPQEPAILVARELLHQNEGRLIIRDNPDEPTTLSISLPRRTMPS